MDVFKLLEEMKQIREAALYDVQNLEQAIERLKYRQHYFAEQALHLSIFCELEKSSENSIHRLIEVLHETHKSIEATERIIDKLQMLVPVVPPIIKP